METLEHPNAHCDPISGLDFTLAAVDDARKRERERIVELINAETRRKPYWTSKAIAFAEEILEQIREEQ